MRDIAKGESTLSDILKPGHFDGSEPLDSVRTDVAEFHKNSNVLNILITKAGMMVRSFLSAISHGPYYIINLSQCHYTPNIHVAAHSSTWQR